MPRFPGLRDTRGGWRRLLPNATACASTLVALAAPASASPSQQPPGIIVDSLRAEDAGQEQAVRPGDILLSWRCLPRATGPGAACDDLQAPAASGVLDAPSDLTTLKVAYSPRCHIIVSGIRDGQPFEVEIPQRLWPISARPHLHGREGDSRDPLAAPARSVTGERRVWLLARAADEASGEQQWQTAGALYEAAAAAASDPVTRGHVMEEWGTALVSQSRFAEAREAYTMAIVLRHSVTGDECFAAQDLGNLGRLAFIRGQLDLAEPCFARVTAINRIRASSSRAWARSLHNLGLIARARGDLDAATACYRTSLRAFAALEPDGKDVATSLTSLGVVAYFRGDLARSQAHFERALSIRQGIDHASLDTARSLENLANVVFERGDLATAEALYLRSLAMKQALAPDSLDVAGVHTNLGVLARAQGDPAAAANHYARALEISTSLAPGSLDTAACLHNLALSTHDGGDPTGATRLLRRALDLKEEIAPDSLEVAMTLSELGWLFAQEGELEEAETALRRALEIEQRVVPDSLWAAATIDKLGVLTIQRGDHAEGMRLLHRALAIHRRLAPDTIEEALVLHELGLAQRAAGDASSALEHMASAVHILEAQTGRLGGTGETLASFRAKHADVYRNYLDLLVVAGNADEAYHALERSRAQNLLAMLTQRDLDFGHDLPPELERRRRIAAANSNRVLSELGSLSATRQAEQVDALLTRLRELRHEQSEIRHEILTASPRLANLSYPQPVTVEDALEVLDPGTVVLAWSLGTDRCHLFVLGPDDRGLEVFSCDVDRSLIRADVERFRLQLRSESRGGRTSLEDRVQRLSQILLAPAAERIASAERVLLVPDGPLHVLPFAALADPTEGSRARWLVEARPLTVISSVTVFSELKKRRRERKNLSVEAFGDPSFHGPASASRSFPDLGPLPASREEVNRLANAYPGAVSAWLGEDATEGRAKALGQQPAIIHFATHALVHDDLPLDSMLALTPPPEPTPARDNGLLQAWEIFEELRIDADLVTLSACDTALGKELAGEGMIGLTRAFQYAGARAVLASLWAVSDRSTAELMGRFYERLARGTSTDRALQAAQVELALETDDELSHPGRWAAFQLIGDYL